jgi:hypothetical protein
MILPLLPWPDESRARGEQGQSKQAGTRRTK